MTQPFDKYERRGAYHWEAFERPSAYRRHVLRLLEWIKEREDDILDVGAGDGQIASLLGCEGIDSDPEAVRLARDRGVGVYQQSVHALVEGYWPAVLLGDVLEHLENPDLVVWHLKRITRRVYVTTPPRQGNALRPHHVQEWTHRELCELFGRHGWQLDQDLGEENDRLYASFRLPDTAIYTALIGTRDTFCSPASTEGSDCLCFTENQNPERTVHDVIYAPHRIEGETSREKQRRVKILADEVWDLYDASVYHDTNVELRRGAGDLLDVLGGCDIALAPHPARETLREEAEKLIELGRIDESAAEEELIRYAYLGLPQNARLWSGFLIVRRHTKRARDFSRIWWQEFRRGARLGIPRDQISLPIAIRASGVEVAEIPPEYYTWHHHRYSHAEASEATA